jgi:hypothetical protein
MLRAALLTATAVNNRLTSIPSPLFSPARAPSRNGAAAPPPQALESPGKFVAYFRVSTARQGRSGLGLEAQQRAVVDHLNGGSWRIVAEFVEVESGKRADNRPKLAEALAASLRTTSSTGWPTTGGPDPTTRIFQIRRR